jgi:hypothetical protein
MLKKLIFQKDIMAFNMYIHMAHRKNMSQQLE